MARQLPDDIDLYFLVGTILIFLLINYNLPLSTIYVAMVLLGALMYLVPIQFSLFKWIPLVKNGGSLWVKVLIGAGFGFGFIQIYKHFTTTPMAAVFATTIFGESEILTKIVYSGLIPPVETIFFFLTILTWWAWKIGDNVHTVSPFSATGIKLMALFAAVFVVFHATAKGVENTTDLFLTLIFGMLSIGMVLYYKEAIQAIVMHITVNMYGMSVMPLIMTWISTNALYAGLIGFAIYYLSVGQKKKHFIPI